MAFHKVVVLFALAALSQAQLVPLASVKGTDAEYDPNPQYQFAYSVQDPITGDAKAQEESRDGDFVKGSYSLVEPDGNVRTVQYTADPVNGFNAVVSRAVGAAPAPVAAPVYKAAPAPIATPIYKAAPAPIATPVYKAAPAPIASPVYKPAYYSPSAYSYQPYRYSGYPYTSYPYSAYPYSGYPYSTYPYAY
ncbi:cuticle protein 7-like [Macrosteles quadrilineatus]|uniref:cuticle protein 7-like n=1 Tax=Macrosteles quadrilineatus TaxID=74068 RepID=UPI0023E116BB|nr:cuticle protein 7-like [Macrosteles quadrilineatus]